MSYYRDKQRAFLALHTLLDKHMSNKENISISGVLYDLSTRFPVSDRALEKQIERFAEVNNLKIKGDELVMK